MSANKYDVGDVVRLRASFTNSAEAAVDPSTVVFQYRQQRTWDPSSFVQLVYGVDSIAKAGTGEYYTDFSVVSGMAGDRVQYLWQGTGNNAAVQPDFFQVSVRWAGGA